MRTGQIDQEPVENSSGERASRRFVRRRTAELVELIAKCAREVRRDIGLVFFQETDLVADWTSARERLVHVGLDRIGATWLGIDSSLLESRPKIPTVGSASARYVAFRGPKYCDKSVLIQLSYNYTLLMAGQTSLIYAGTKLQVRWMRYEHDFPARSFLENYPDDFARFLLRAEEMGNAGRISLPSQGHALSGKAYRGLYEFKMTKTRAYGFEHGRRFIVVSAATKKEKKPQIMDHDLAAKLRQNYLDHVDDQND